MEAMIPWLSSQWGNPSSIHAPGRAALRAVEAARMKVAAFIGASSEQVVFTSGATEANNAAIHSALLQNPDKRHVVTSMVEHSSVLAYCDYLQEHWGVEVTKLPVDSEGNLSVDDLRATIRQDTAIVSLMWANNETGVIWPVSQLAEICAEKGVIFHSDAVQAVGKVTVDFNACGVSFLSLSGHKFGAPKGIGALVMADPNSYLPSIVGGKQEHGHRGGTENVPHIVAIGIAAETAYKREQTAWSKVAQLLDIFEQTVIDGIVGAEINGSRRQRLPNTTNIYLPGLDSDALVTFLDQNSICVSSGSACLESAITPSHVILAMSNSHVRASESIRISVGLNTNAEELLRLTETIANFSAVNA